MFNHKYLHSESNRSFANTPAVITSVTKARNHCLDYDAPDFQVHPSGVYRGGFTLYSYVVYKATCGDGVQMKIMYMACGTF